MSPKPAAKSKNTGLGAGAKVFFPEPEEEGDAQATLAVRTIEEGGGAQAAPAATTVEEGGGAHAAPVATTITEPSDSKSVRQKSRTTVILYNDTLESIELLKAKSRKQGVKASMSDILNDAVELLMQERQKQSAQ